MIKNNDTSSKEWKLSFLTLYKTNWSPLKNKSIQYAYSALTPAVLHLNSLFCCVPFTDNTMAFWDNDMIWNGLKLSLRRIFLNRVGNLKCANAKHCSSLKPWTQTWKQDAHIWPAGTGLDWAIDPPPPDWLFEPGISTEAKWDRESTLLRRIKHATIHFTKSYVLYRENKPTT